MIRIAFALLSLSVAPAFACPEEAAASAKTGAHCDMPSTTATAELPKDGTHSTFAVSGMHCGACADKVHAALMAAPGVTGARVSLTDNQVEVVYDKKLTDTTKLIALVNAGGEFKASAKQM